MTTSKLPQPKTTRAILISAGLPVPTPTVHHYVETKPCTLPDGTPVFEHLFQCFKTGVVRRWGFDHRNELNESELEQDIEAEGN